MICFSLGLHLQHQIEMNLREKNNIDNSCIKPDKLMNDLMTQAVMIILVQPEFVAGSLCVPSEVSVMTLKL